MIQNRFVKCRGWDEDEVVVDAILANSTVPYAYETRPVRVRDASRTRTRLDGIDKCQNVNSFEGHL